MRLETKNRTGSAGLNSAACEPKQKNEVHKLQDSLQDTFPRINVNNYFLTQRGHDANKGLNVHDVNLACKHE